MAEDKFDTESKFKFLTSLFKLISLLLLTGFLIIFLTYKSNLAYAVIDKDITIGNLIGDGGSGGTSKSQIYLVVNEEHTEEISNFTGIKNQTVTAYNSLVFPIYSRPSMISDYNKLDKIICMIKKLEDYAKDFSYNRININNYVLGYIRGINKSYTGSSEHDGSSIYDSSKFLSTFGLSTWQAICGSIDYSFISHVLTSEPNNELRMFEFFSSFLLEPENYNSYYYGSLQNSYIFTKKYKLSDPLGSGQTIDFLHMIASLDSVYENTYRNDTVCKLAIGNTTFQKDLASWLGDLQTFTAEIYKNGNVNALSDYKLEYGHIDFNEFVDKPNKKVYTFSCEDLLADIDAFNIATFFLNNSFNSLSDSIIGYYTSLNNDDNTKGNRYYEFIYNCTRELQNPSSGSMEQDFRNEICSSLNVKYENGIYSDYDYYSHDSWQLKMLCSNGYPNFETRKYCAKLFCDYIINMSHRF